MVASNVRWTNKTPARAGYYWTRNGDGTLPTIVNVFPYELGYMVEGFIHRKPKDVQRFSGRQWAGPLDPPE